MHHTFTNSPSLENCYTYNILYTSIWYRLSCWYATQSNWYLRCFRNGYVFWLLNVESILLVSRDESQSSQRSCSFLLVRLHDLKRSAVTLSFLVQGCHLEHWWACHLELTHDSSTGISYWLYAKIIVYIGTHLFIWHNENFSDITTTPTMEFFDHFPDWVCLELQGNDNKSSFGIDGLLW